MCVHHPNPSSTPGVPGWAVLSVVRSPEEIVLIKIRFKFSSVHQIGCLFSIYVGMSVRLPFFPREQAFCHRVSLGCSGVNWELPSAKSDDTTWTQTRVGTKKQRFKWLLLHISFYCERGNESFMQSGETLHQNQKHHHHPSRVRRLRVAKKQRSHGIQFESQVKINARKTLPVSHFGISGGRWLAHSLARICKISSAGACRLESCGSQLCRCDAILRFFFMHCRYRFSI